MIFPSSSSDGDRGKAVSLQIPSPIFSTFLVPRRRAETAAAAVCRPGGDLLMALMENREKRKKWATQTAHSLRH